MTDELGSSARALLDAARPGLSPDAAAIQRMRAKIDVAVTTGGAAGAAGATSTLGAKLGLLAVVATIAIGGYLYATRDRAPASRPVVEITAPAPITSPPPKTAPPITTPVAIADDKPLPKPAPVKTKQVAKPVPPPVEAPDIVLAPDEITPKRKGIDLAREVELVDHAMAAMRRGDPRAALVAVRTHATETAGAGQLAEDAAAIEVEALCKLGDASVKAKLAAFDKRWPSSAQRSRLTTKCP